ncbi:MAG: ABC transporter permease [Eggerthella lenta]
MIDRDGSALSDGLAAYLREQGIEVPIEDSQMALQDAVAKGQSSYILIVPEGFGDAFVEAARTGDELPTLETVYSFYSTEGSLMDQMVNSYLGIAGAYAGLEGSASQGDIVQHAAEAMAESAETDSVEVGGTSSEAQRFVFFLQWGTYTLFASIIVCVGVMMTTLNRTDLRRRNLVSPLPSLSYGLQLAASSLLVMTAVWLWTICLGFTVFHEATSMISGPGLALMVAASFVFATIPLSVGYLLGQLGVGEFASNALGNILGRVISFLGGAWISFDLLDPSVQMLAHFSPAYWYTGALQAAADMGAATPEAVIPILENMGVMLLFTAAIFAVALVAGRLRVQSSEAGGNAAAAHATHG